MNARVVLTYEPTNSETVRELDKMVVSLGIKPGGPYTVSDSC